MNKVIFWSAVSIVAFVGGSAFANEILTGLESVQTMNGWPMVK